MTRSNRAFNRQHPNGDDALVWTMRATGTLLAAISLLFLTEDVFLGTAAGYFLSLTAGTGILTVVTSWLPARGDAMR